MRGIGLVFSDRHIPLTTGLHQYAPADTPSRAVARTRLLKFVVDFGSGGTERQFVNLGLALDRDRLDLRFGCLRRRGGYLDDVERRGIPVREYRIASFYSMRCLREQWRLARDIARHGIHIVHAYNFYGNVFAVPAARWASAPVVIAAIRDRGVYLNRRQLAVQRHVCRLADCVLVNAEAIKDWLVDQGYDATKIAVIPNGVDTATFSGPRRAPAHDLRREFGLPDEAPLVGVIGRVNAMKGLEPMIDATALLANRHRDLRVLVVGEALATRDGAIVEDRAYLDSLKDRARRLGVGDRIVFTGHRADVSAVLAQVSVSVQPSLSEGLSNVVLESMAAGAPVVATRVGGTPEAVTDHVTGLLVPPADPRALAGAIARLLDDRPFAAALGRAARQRIEEKFSLARMVRATAELYGDLLDRKTRARRHAS